MSKMQEKLIKSFNNAKQESNDRMLNIEEKMRLADGINNSSKGSHAQPTVKTAFSCPMDEYHIIDQITNRMLDMKKVINRSEILRMGLLLLKHKSDTELLELFSQIPTIKVGRKT